MGCQRAPLLPGREVPASLIRRVCFCFISGSQAGGLHTTLPTGPPTPVPSSLSPAVLSLQLGPLASSLENEASGPEATFCSGFFLSRSCQGSTQTGDFPRSSPRRGRVVKSGSFANHWAPTPKPQPLAAPSRLDSMSVICYSVLTAVLPCPKLGVLARLGSPRRCTRTQRTGPVPLSAPSTVLRSAQPPGSLPTPGPLQTLPNAGLSSNHPPNLHGNEHPLP